MGDPLVGLLLNYDWYEHHYYCLCLFFPLYIQVMNQIILEFQVSVEQRDIVAATNTRWANFSSLSSSCLL